MLAELISSTSGTPIEFQIKKIAQKVVVSGTSNSTFKEENLSAENLTKEKSLTKNSESVEENSRGNTESTAINSKKEKNEKKRSQMYKSHNH